LSTNNSTEIANRDLQTSSYSTLRGTADIHGRPAKYQRNRRIDTSCAEEHADVGYTWFVEDDSLGLVLVDVGIGEEDDVADSGCASCSDDEGGADVAFFGDDGDADGQDRGEYVGRDGEELCGCCCVAEVLDDGRLEWVSALRLKSCMCYIYAYQEERQRVQWQ